MILFIIYLLLFFYLTFILKYTDRLAEQQLCQFYISSFNPFVLHHIYLYFYSCLYFAHYPSHAIRPFCFHPQHQQQK